MLSSSSFSCWLIGADSLLEECGNILLRDQHAIHGVISAAGRVADWAASRSLEVVDPEGDYASVLARRPCDYLFSINHLALVPDEVLRMPLRCAINFHDGPLPDYAGLNAPVWALINRERKYGVTWHVMTSTVDAGDILKQRRFEVADEETALSLNAKCFEAALDSFAELIGELASQPLQPISQNRSQRRYFERARRPLAACAIDWKQPAEEIEALVRALSFGRYANPVGLAKIHNGASVFAVTHAKADAAANGHMPPGTMLALDDRSMLVATGRGAIELRGFADLRGTTLRAPDVARRLDLVAGASLGSLAPEPAQRLTELDRRMSRSERVWVQRLCELDPLTLTCPIAAPDPSVRPQAAALDVAVPAKLSELCAEHSPSTVLTAAFCAFAARLARRRNFDIGYGDLALRNATEGLEAWVAARVPLRIEVRDGEGLQSFVARVSAGVAEIRRRGPWLRDAVARYPELRALREDRAAHLLPVAVECSRALEQPTLPDGAQWTFEICDSTGSCRCVYDAARISAVHAQSMLRGFSTFLASLVANRALPLNAHDIVDAEERARQLSEWNQAHRNQAPRSQTTCIHDEFVHQALRTPSATAVVCEGRSLTYAELDQRANLLAHELRRLGVRAGTLVGICVERSLDLVVAIFGTLKAGGAYVPLDPALPSARLSFMVEDAELGVIVVHEQLATRLPANGAQLVCIDSDWQRIASTPPEQSVGGATAEHLAYVIYTSGSTGRPKGVLVEHRNVASFFAAIDEVVPHDPPGTWLAVTSLSFDISVLELLWTLTRGFKVVLHSGREREVERTNSSARSVAFSLFYFSSNEGQDHSDAYRLLLEGARFADANGFRAVWTPERHFHAFGGLFPNPAVTGAALAAITQQVEIRAGSVVLPLHHPIRVAEEWALVDNLSGGRVAISFASGWHPDDFVLAPHNRERAKDVMLRDIEVVRRLWRGETVEFPGPDGAAVEVRTHPRPVQPELPIWITSAGNVETYASAGRLGANLLTHLLGQSIEELAPKIEVYRRARAEAGLDPDAGVVAVMLHAFVGDDEARVREQVREPLERYLGSSLSLLERHADAFPAFRRAAAAGKDGGLAELAPEERAALLAHARERYYETSGLFGTPERCAEMVERLRAIGVDELACLIDFGVSADEVLASLPLLDRVRREAQARSAVETAPVPASLADVIRREGVTHLQCTPSMARLLCADPQIRGALRQVQVFVGGEALPEALARELALSCARLTNLYGPTETTIWSSAHAVAPVVNGASHSAPAGCTPIGRPLANTRFYVTDEQLGLLPIGVAGELVIGGPGVARGYLRRPELDLERFVPEPFGTVDGARAYRTGDLVRYRSDGVLEFLGRTDHQIKLRGHRIEPGEIESVIARDSAVAEVVVVAREDSPGDQRLVAYVVARAATPDSALLRERLKEQLPEPMVPSQLVFLARLPRTPNGKIDRRALPAPVALEPSVANGEQPASELESRLADLWQETLGLEHVGVESNFFDLGGHSLLAVRIHQRLSEWAPRPVSLTDLFRFPTIRSLAGFLTSGPAPAGLEQASARGRRRRLARRRQRTGDA